MLDCVYTCQKATLLEITCHGSIGFFSDVDRRSSSDKAYIFPS